MCKIIIYELKFMLHSNKFLFILLHFAIILFILTLNNVLSGIFSSKDKLNICPVSANNILGKILFKAKFLFTHSPLLSFKSSFS